MMIHHHPGWPEEAVLHEALHEGGCGQQCTATAGGRQQCIVTWQQCIVTWQQCIVTWQQCFVTWQQCIVTWQQCM
jgi:hypothetical protein